MSQPRLLLRDGVPVAYFGRDGKEYPIYDNTINLYLDSPVDENPYSIIFMQDSQIELKGVINASTVESLGREFGNIRVAQPEDSSNLH